MNGLRIANKRTLVILIVVVHCISEVAQTAEPSSQRIALSNEYWYAEWIDTAGYSDKFWWGPSPRHSVQAEHEMLSGKRAAASGVVLFTLGQTGGRQTTRPLRLFSPLAIPRSPVILPCPPCIPAIIA